MKNLFLFLFVIIISCSIKCQSLDSLPIYNIVNEKFDSIFIAFIEHEKQYDYYDSTCIFRMFFLNNSDSSTTINLISGYKLNELSYHLYTFKNQKNTFFIRSQNHYWDAMPRSYSLDTTLLSKCEEYFYYSSAIKYEKKLQKPNEIIPLDDRFFETWWTYRYKNGELYEIVKAPRNYGKIEE